MTYLCTAVPRPQQNCAKKNGNQRKFSAKPFNFKPQYSSDNQSESSSDEMQLGEDESKRFSVTNFWQFAKVSTSTLKNRNRVCLLHRDQYCCCSQWQFRTSKLNHKPLWICSCLSERDSVKDNINSLKYSTQEGLIFRALKGIITGSAIFE